MIALSCDCTEYSTLYCVLTSPADDIVQQTALAHAAHQEEYGQTQGGNLNNNS